MSKIDTSLRNQFFLLYSKNIDIMKAELLIWSCIYQFNQCPSPQNLRVNFPACDHDNTSQ